MRAAAAADAAALYRDKGADAVAFLTARMTQPESNADDRRRDRLARIEVERLDRVARNGPPIAPPAPSQPKRFGMGGFAALFGFGRRR